MFLLDDLPSDVVLSAGDDVTLLVATFVPLSGEVPIVTVVVVDVLEELTMLVGIEVSMK